MQNKTGSIEALFNEYQSSGYSNMLTFSEWVQAETLGALRDLQQSGEKAHTEMLIALDNLTTCTDNILLNL